MKAEDLMELRRLQIRVQQQADDLRQANAQLQIELAERGRAQEEMRASQRRIRAITDSAQDAILMMDPEGRLSYWNPAAERVFGYTSAEALGQNLHDLIAPARFHPAFHRAFAMFQRTGQGAALGRTLDLAALRKDGKEISIQLSLSPVQINGDWHALGIIRDTTESKRAELEIRHQAAFAHFNPNPVLELSATGEIAYFNDAAREMARALGLENPARTLPPDTATMVRECLATGKPRLCVETQIGPRVISWSFFPVEFNRVVHSYAGDITERKQTEAERNQIILELQNALANVKLLSGMIPICAGCKKIRDDRGFWSQVESYISEHSEAKFTHGLCPDCTKIYFPGLQKED